MRIDQTRNECAVQQRDAPRDLRPGRQQRLSDLRDSRSVDEDRSGRYNAAEAAAP
jgi:hypothetical protein